MRTWGDRGALVRSVATHRRRWWCKTLNQAISSSGLKSLIPLIRKACYNILPKSPRRNSWRHSLTCKEDLTEISRISYLQTFKEMTTINISRSSNSSSSSSISSEQILKTDATYLQIKFIKNMASLLCPTPGKLHYCLKRMADLSFRIRVKFSTQVPCPKQISQPRLKHLR